jgi:hypothetical protein
MINPGHPATSCGYRIADTPCKLEFRAAWDPKISYDLYEISPEMGVFRQTMENCARFCCRPRLQAPVKNTRRSPLFPPGRNRREWKYHHSRSPGPPGRWNTVFPKLNGVKSPKIDRLQNPHESIDIRRFLNNLLGRNRPIPLTPLWISKRFVHLFGSDDRLMVSGNHYPLPVLAKS